MRGNGVSTRRLTVPKVMLVYQAGIANVFAVRSFNMSDYGRDARRLYQGDFRTAEAMVRGMGFAGTTVRVAACNMAGDVARALWTRNLDEQPFSESYRAAEWERGEVCAIVQAGEIIDQHAAHKANTVLR